MVCDKIAKETGAIVTVPMFINEGDVIKYTHAEVLDTEGNFYTDNMRSAKNEIFYTFKGDGVESDKFFVRKLLQASFAGYEKYSAMVAEAVTGWEKERLFSTDVVLIAMGLAEAVTFPTIPVKVTMNEYVEISKFYGTPKSRSFVNGLLDKLVQQLANEGQISKEGKGLL